MQPPEERAARQPDGDRAPADGAGQAEALLRRGADGAGGGRLRAPSRRQARHDAGQAAARRSARSILPRRSPRSGWRRASSSTRPRCRSRGSPTAAIDGVASRLADVRAEVLSYAGTDLLCYRAGEPEALVARQREAWDPILGLGGEALRRALLLAEGLVHVAQPEGDARGASGGVRRLRRPVPARRAQPRNDALRLCADRARACGGRDRHRHRMGRGACRRGLEHREVGRGRGRESEPLPPLRRFPRRRAGARGSPLPLAGRG